MTQSSRQRPPLSGATRPLRIFVLGATGDIGRATVRALLDRGHQVVCLVRPRAGAGANLSRDDSARLLAGAEIRFGEAANPGSLTRDGFRGEQFDVLVSCLASRTGVAADAWAIDHRAHVDALTAAKAAGVKQMVLLSAICVQKPRLAFQYAKLAFEQALIESGLVWSIVRPTAYFKSLSGQVARVKAGKPYLIFGDGALTACKPISDRDLGTYMADCIDHPERHNKILPIGGPGPAQTPREQGEILFQLIGRTPRFSKVPTGLLGAIAAALGTLGRVIPSLATKAELARIGRYYATESMLVLNPETGLYDADATPETGTDTLADYHAGLIRGETTLERSEQSVF